MHGIALQPAPQTAALRCYNLCTGAPRKPRPAALSASWLRLTFPPLLRPPLILHPPPAPDPAPAPAAAARKLLQPSEPEMAAVGGEANPPIQPTIYMRRKLSKEYDSADMVVRPNALCDWVAFGWLRQLCSKPCGQPGAAAFDVPRHGPCIAIAHWRLRGAAGQHVRVAARIHSCRPPACPAL